MKQKLQRSKVLLGLALLCISTLIVAREGVASFVDLAFATSEIVQTELQAEVVYEAPIVVSSEEEPENGLKLRYTFEGVTGQTVPDASGSGYDGTLKNQATIMPMGKYNVLSLGNGTGYLDMGKNVGEVISSMNDFTVSVYYRVDKNASLSGAGYFLWAFSVLSVNTATSGPYVGYRLNAQRFALSPNGWDNENSNSIERGGEATKNTWQHMLYRQTGKKGELYIDGRLVGTNTGMPIPSSAFTTSPSYNWIGRPPFNGDSYLKNTLVYDFRLYNQAVTNGEISELADVIEDLNYEYSYGTVGDFTQLTTLLAECDDLLAPGNVDKYPATAVEEFTDVVVYAQNLVAANKASQSLIDEWTATLQSACNTLKATEGFVFGDVVSEGYDTNKGFKHPGALHTQEDFDRVKALLEANDPTAVAAYNRLKANGYSQSNVQTWPTEWIIRGGGVGENYMNAARGATMAYQNALRWKISGDKAHADRAVHILNSWVAVCVGIGGDTNQSLASGLYGYQFANAAELMRDYEGWNAADFKAFQEWMLYLWYPRCIDFLRRRHDTWRQNRPGHYWSNWGLCNSLAVMSIGVLCDDVFIYNQGAAFYKYDQVGNFTDDQNPPIVNLGLTEFVGNLVPATHADERGPYGYLGQMQESGRDQGHALMAAGLAVDICQVGWNQGDDLFALMDNRIAAGFEYIAAYNTGVEDVPWTEYWYHDVRTAIHNSWKMGGNNGGGRGGFRPYWDRIIGHFEGVKGVSMPYSRAMKAKDPIDDGCGSYGVTSGGFDHLGVTTLMCSRPTITPEEAPTLIKPSLIYNGKTYQKNDLGGIDKNTFNVSATTAIPVGSMVKFVPQLPDDVTDTGNWLWSTGATTKDLEITANNSGLYRVTYTNDKGIKSTQLFSVAVKGDCTPDELTPYMTADGVTISDTVITVMARTPVRLAAWGRVGWGTHRWSNGSTAGEITVSNINSDRTYSLIYANQGGRETKINFHIRVLHITPSLSVDAGDIQEIDKVVVAKGQSVELRPIIASGMDGGTWEWNTGATTKNLLIEDVQNTGHYSVTYTISENEKYSLEYHVYIPGATNELADGVYYIKDFTKDLYLTNNTSSNIPTFQNKNDVDNTAQTWNIAKDGVRYKITSALDNRFLNEQAQFGTGTYFSSWNTYSLYGVEDGDLYAIRNGGSSGTYYWTINNNSSITGKGSSTMKGYPFEIVSVSGTDGVDELSTKGNVLVYPNPVQDYLIVQTEEDGVFTLFSTNGTMVKNVSCSAGKNTVQVSELPAGLYLGILQANGQRESFKIIKK